jgi:hypothetical protein
MEQKRIEENTKLLPLFQHSTINKEKIIKTRTEALLYLI